MARTASTARARTNARASAPSLDVVRPDLWRVSAASGSILGHIERIEDVRGSRFLARRLVSGMPSATSIGEFWTVQDAVDCFRSR